MTCCTRRKVLRPCEDHESGEDCDDDGLHIVDSIEAMDVCEEDENIWVVYFCCEAVGSSGF